MHLLPPLSHKLLLCLGHADHLGDRMGIRFKAIHTHSDYLFSFSYFPTRCYVLADRPVFAVNGCALVCFLLLPVLFQENEKPTK